MSTPRDDWREEIEWFSQLSEGWSRRKLKHVTDIVNSNVDKKSYEDGHPVRLCNYTDVYYNEFIDSGMDLMRATATESEIERFSLREGDVLITKDSEAWDDIAVPACVTDNPTDVVCGYHLTMLRPHEGVLLGRFLLRALQSSGVREQFHVAAKGITRYGLSLHHIQDAEIPLPPIEEQIARADYIDRKTEGIDTLIRKKQALIDLLREQRTALIHRAVTKGLDPDAPMKDSGIEWLGEVPNHWEVPLLRYVAQLKSGDSITSESIEPEGDYPVFGGNGIRGYADSFTHEGEYALVGRQGALCGNVNFASGRFWASEHAVVVTPNNGYLTAWLGNLLSAMNLGQYSVAAAQPGLAVETIKALRIPVPPPLEQAGIAEFIASKSEQAETVIRAEETAVRLLRELRTSLISEVVTGKIDVREVEVPTEKVQPFAWWMLGNYVIRQMRDEERFGKTVLVKVLYVLQHHLRIQHSARYKRWDHGPYSPKMMKTLESKLKGGGFHRAVKVMRDGYEQVVYEPLENAEDPKDYFGNAWANRQPEIDQIINLFRPLGSTGAEIIATLYAAWNDLLIAGKTPTDAEIIEDVRFNWHAKKQDIPPETWQRGLNWMREQGLEPSGFGQPVETRSGKS